MKEKLKKKIKESKYCPVCKRTQHLLVFYQCPRCKRYVCPHCFIAEAENLPIELENFLCKDCWEETRGCKGCVYLKIDSRVFPPWECWLPRKSKTSPRMIKLERYKKGCKAKVVRRELP